MSTIHQELIKVIKTKTPEGINTVDLITSIIPISKEAAYRRLRDESSFTLDEVVHICRKLNISIDRLIEMKQENKFIFRFNHITSAFSMDEYYEMMERTVKSLNYMRNDPNSYIYTAQNALSLTFSLRHRMLSQIKLFKWAYQLNLNPAIKKVSEMVIPEKILDAHKEYYEKMKSISLFLILDENGMKSFIDDINFFATLDIISPDEIQQVKEELRSMLDEMELTARAGSFLDGAKAQIYISHTVFDSAYIYAHSEHYSACSFYAYSSNYLVCDNLIMGKYQKRWIESLMRFSTLISGCGEIERIKFFKAQRELVNTL